MLPQSEIDASPKITLAGKEWPIPMLAPRQQRVVLPKLLGLMKDLTKGGTALDPTGITDQQYDDLVDVVYASVTRAHPELTKDQFLDMPIGLFELFAATDTIAMQTGMIKRAKAEIASSGEAQAGNSQTGIASSQE